MFNQELHRRLDGEKEHELTVAVLESLDRQLHDLFEREGWSEDDGLRQVLATGLKALSESQEADKPPGEMTPEERMRFLQDRWSRAEAAYSTMKFQAYQVMNQNDALEMNMKGLLPQLEAARQRVGELEDEVRRLRALVPEEQRKGDVLVLDTEQDEADGQSLGAKVRRLFKP